MNFTTSIISNPTATTASSTVGATAHTLIVTPQTRFASTNRAAINSDCLQTERKTPSLYDAEGIPLYKWNGQAVVKRTAEEIAADQAAIPAPPPSEMERLRADIDFLAAMGGMAL